MKTTKLDDIEEAVENDNFHKESKKSQYLHGRLENWSGFNHYSRIHCSGKGAEP